MFCTKIFSNSYSSLGTHLTAYRSLIYLPLGASSSDSLPLSSTTLGSSMVSDSVLAPLFSSYASLSQNSILLAARFFSNSFSYSIYLYSSSASLFISSQVCFFEALDASSSLFSYCLRVLSAKYCSVVIVFGFMQLGSSSPDSLTFSR